jgi:NTE family protein
MIGFIPEKERALVLQGGGSLGAYEAGAYKAIYETLSKEDNAKPISHRRSTFDIVAGTSIGAINAAILVSYVMEMDPMMDRLKDLWISGITCPKSRQQRLIRPSSLGGITGTE